ncbi:MAG: hypothetical protein JEZ14_15950 [Marinilabiliaceae bacterium]|nr:hypothetical protein [Marinilabiliaceae bacterium]
MRNYYIHKMSRRAKVLAYSLFIVFFTSVVTSAQTTTWYSLASGDWNDPDIWTQDPAGAVPVNPSGEYPDDVNDNIVILSGKTVTIPDGVTPYDVPLNDLDNLSCGIITIEGQLDIRTSQGHTYTEIRGSGRILLAGDNFPAGDATDFITEGEDEGTVVFYGNDFTLSAADTFYNLEVDMTAGQTVSIAADYTLNGNLLIKGGTLQLGDATTTKYTLTVNGNTTVNSGTFISVGSGVGISGVSFSDFHHLICYGDILNNGSIRLTNQANPVYNAYSTSGAAILTMQGTTNNNFTCNGTTDLYRLVVNKGSDQTYEVFISASAEGNFRLYGRNNASGEATKGLYLQNGTLKLGGSVFIPTLTEGGSDFVIPGTAALWLSGAGVKVYSTARSDAETLVGGIQGTGVDGTATGSQSFSVYGKFRQTDGIFDSNSHGFVVWNTGNAIILIEGGTVETPGLRSAGGSTGKYSYIQTGGTVTMYGDIDSDGIEATSATFSIKGSDNIFMMSGGTLEILDANYVTAAGYDRAFEVESADGNYNVSGGTVRFNYPNTTGGNSYYISSTAPLYNFELDNQGGSATNVFLENQDLVVLDDITINGNCALDVTMSNIDMYIGHDFNLATGGSFNARSNTVYFNEGSNSLVDNTPAITFNDVVVDKDDIVTPDTWYEVEFGGAGAVTIGGNLTVTQGEFNVGALDVSLQGNIEISDGNITSEVGGVPSTGTILLNGSSQQTLKGKVGKNPSFGAIQLNNTNGIALLSHVDVESFSFLSNRVVDLDRYNLDISTADYTAGTWSASRMFRTAGAASNSGLTLPIVLDGSTYSDDVIQIFPLGTASGYTPATIRVDGTLTDIGEMTVVPVDDNHPTTITDFLSLDYYWKVEYTGLSTVTANDMRYVLTYYTAIPTGGSWRGWVLNDNNWNDYVGINSGNDLDFNFGTYLTLDYTWGSNVNFNAPKTFYSRADGQSGGSAQFDDRDSWTEDPDHDGSRGTRSPLWYDFCVLGGANGANHTIIIDGNDDASQVYVKGKSETGISAGDPPTLQMTGVGTGTDLEFVKGLGRVYSTDGTVPDADFSDICGNTEAIFEYGGAGSYDITISSDIPYYPNLYLTGSGSKSGDNDDLLVNGDLFVDDATFNVSLYANGDVTIFDDIIINTGDLVLPNGVTRILNIAGDITFTGNGDFRVNTGGSAREHQLNLEGNITQGDGNIDFFATANANVNFIGTETATVSKSGAGTTDFYKLHIDKPSDKKVQFTGAFTLNGPTNGTTKALDLQSGECHLDNSGINIDLSTGGGDFKIATGTTLRVDNGATVNVSGTTTGIWLDDALIIDNSGKVYCNGGSDNYIEYSASGNASIWVGDAGELLVGSQIRRNDVTEEGIMSFTQAKATSTIIIGEDNAPTNDRGVFEILNAGSSFTQTETGSNITIVRSQTTPSKAALLFDPATSFIAAGAGFTIGNASTPAGQTIGIYAGQNLMDLIIEGANAPTAKAWIVPITFDGNLTINTGAFDANGLDVTLQGNLTNSGTYTANGNTTYLEGASDQTITGNTTFYNLVKQTTANALNIGAATAVTVTNDLDLQTGSLNTGDNTISVAGDLTNEIITSSTGASQGILLNGTDIQEIGGGGSYDVLTINNSNGIVLPTQSGSINFIDRLRMVDGVFDIGRNLLVLEENGYVEEVNPFSATNMIQTNLSFVDAGIEKFFPVITASTNYTYPIGSLGKYTPVDMDITNNGNNTGSIRVKAANERHISIIDDPGTPYDDTQNVLQYNWTLDATGIEGFSASVVMTGDAGDVLVTAPNTSADYITARILLGSVDWNKFNITDFNEATTELTFTFSGTDDLGIDGDYTAGVSDAIPDQVPAFITVASGPWTTTTTWAIYDPDIPSTGAPGVGVPAGGPRGSIIYVDHNLTFPVNFEAAYRTVVNASGVIDIASSIGHRLGDVSGTGIIKLENGDLPAGVYNDFFSATGGTLEYTGSGSYDILGSITALNNLVLSGTNERRFPDLDIQLLGDLTMSGADVVNTNNRNLSVQGDIRFSGGTYDAGTAVDSKVPTITLNGSSLQSVYGAVHFTSAGGGALYDLKIDNASGADIVNDMEVSDKLILTNGVLNTAAGGSLTVTNSLAAAVTGGSNTAYVQGALGKSINNGDNFTFPVGDALRYGPINVATDGTSGGIWETQYFNHNPGDDAKDPDSFTGDVAYVSHNEYWRIQSPAAGNATLTLNWDELSGVTPDGNFRVVEWADLATDAWQEVAIGAPVGDETGGSVATSSAMVFNEFVDGNFYTFGTILVPSYSWEGDDPGTPTDWFTAENWSGGIVPNAASDVTIVNVANDPEIDNTALVQVNDLTINAGATLTLLEGGRMTVNGNSITNNGLNIENTTINPSSFIHLGSVTGDVVIQWSYPEERYWYIGHTISNVTIANYEALVGGGNAYLLYEYNGAWNNLTGVGDGFAEPLEGYALRIRDPGATVTHQGSLNVLDYTGVNARTLSTGWHLIANPYASYLDIESSDDWEFGGADSTIYTRTTVGAERTVATYNVVEKVGTNGGTRYITPGQCFWVRHIGADEFGIASGARTHASGQLKSESSEPDDIFRLSMTNRYTTDETLILFRNSGANTLTGSDSHKRFESSATIPMVYSLKNENSLVINTMPLVEEETIIPLGYKVGETGAGEMTLAVSNIDLFLPQISVYLEDKVSGKWIDMRQQPSYTFKTSATTNNDRFILYFRESVSTQNEAEQAEQLSQILIYSIGNKAIIKVPDELLRLYKGEGRARIHSIKGELLVDVPITRTHTELSLPDGTGLYLVKVAVGSKVQVRIAKIVKFIP